MSKQLSKRFGWCLSMLMIMVMTLVGTTTAKAANSSVTFTPNPAFSTNGDEETYVETTKGEDFTFTITFSAPVKMKQVGAGIRGNISMPYEPAGDVYATEFSYTFTADYIKDQQELAGLPEDSEYGPSLYATIQALDEAGDEINNGYINVFYGIKYPTAPGADFNVTVPTQASGQLMTFQVSPLEGYSYLDANNADLANNVFGDITITGNGYEGHAVSYAKNADGGGTVTFADPIMNSGAYQIQFPFSAFSIGREAGEGDEGDVTAHSAQKTVDFNVTILESTDILLDNPNWYPSYEAKYYFTPVNSGTLRLTIGSNNAATNPVPTNMVGGLYSNARALIQPSAMNAGATYSGDWGDFYSNVEWLEYEVEAGVEYYFTWTKNADGNEFSVTATYAAETSVTLVFDGPTSAVSVKDLTNDKDVVLNGNTLEVLYTEYPTEYQFTFAADVEVNVSGDVAANSTEGYETWGYSATTTDDTTVGVLSLWAGAAGATITVEISGEEEAAGDGEITVQLALDSDQIGQLVVKDVTTGAVIPVDKNVLNLTGLVWPTHLYFALPNPDGLEEEFDFTSPGVSQEYEETFYFYSTYLDKNFDIEGDVYYTVGDLQIWEGVNGKTFTLSLNGSTFGGQAPEYNATIALSVPAAINDQVALYKGMKEEAQEGEDATKDGRIGTGDGSYSVVFDATYNRFSVFGPKEGYEVEVGGSVPMNDNTYSYQIEDEMNSDADGNETDATGKVAVYIQLFDDFADQTLTVTFTEVSTDEPGGEGGENELPINESFKPEKDVQYTYTPTADGVLTATTEGGRGMSPYANFIYQNGEPVAPSEYSGDDGNFGYMEMQWELEGGLEYVFELPSGWDLEEIGNFLFTWSGDDSGETPGEGDGNTLPIDESFKPEKDVQYTYTPTTDGVLTATTEGGRGMSPYANFIYQNGEPVAPSEYSGDDGNFGYMEMQWELKGGLEYVFELPSGWDLDEIGNFLFTWEGNGSTPEVPSGDGEVSFEITPATVVGTLILKDMTTGENIPVENASLNLTELVWPTTLYFALPYDEDNEQEIDITCEGLEQDEDATWTFMPTYLDSDFDEVGDPAYVVGILKLWDGADGHTFKVSVSGSSFGGEAPEYNATIAISAPDAILGDIVLYNSADEVVESKTGNNLYQVTYQLTENNTYYVVGPKTTNEADYDVKVYCGDLQPGDTTFKYNVEEEMDSNEQPTGNYRVSLQLFEGVADQYVDVEFVEVETEEPGNDNDWVELQLGETYTAGWVGVSTVGAPGYPGYGTLKLTYTPEKDVLFTAHQGNGNMDNHLWSAVPDVSWVLTQSGVAEYQGNLGENQVKVFQQPAETSDFLYKLAGGHTYYFYARINSYDDLTTVTFEASELPEVTEEMVVDTEYTLYEDDVYKFVATGNGYLTVNVNTVSTAFGGTNSQYVFYTSSTCADGTQVPMTGFDDSSYFETGLAFTFYVTEGTTYYVYDPSWNYDDFMFGAAKYYLTFEAGELEAKLVKVEPTPGEAFGKQDFGNYFNLNFSPSDATAESVTLTYISAETNQAETVEITDFGVKSDQNDTFYISAQEVNDVITNKLAAEGSLLTFTLTGVKAGGIYVTEYAPAAEYASSKDYVTVDENGLIEINFQFGEPITIVESGSTIPSELYWFINNDGTVTTTDGQTVSDVATEIVLRYDGQVRNYESIALVEGVVYEGGGANNEAQVNSYEFPSGMIDIANYGDEAEGEEEYSIITIRVTNQNFSAIPAGTATLLVKGVTGTNGLIARYNGGSNTWYTPTLRMNESEVPKNTLKEFNPGYLEELTVNEDGTASFDVIFSGPTMVTSAVAPMAGMNEIGGYECEFSQVDGNGGDYATTWNVVLPAVYVATQIESGENAMCNIVAVDVNGNPIIYGDLDCVTAEFTLPEGEKGVDFNVITVATAEEELDYFTVEPLEGYDGIAANDINDAYGNNPFLDITIMAQSGPYIGKAKAMVDGTVTFEPAITESGDYQISFPYQAFNITEPQNDPNSVEPGKSHYSKEKVYDFSVTITEKVEEPDYMEEASMIDPVVNGDGEVSESNFHMMVGLTWDYEQISALSTPVYATVTNPDGKEVKVAGVPVPYDPEAKEDEGSTGPEVGTSYNSVLSFNISAAAQEMNFPFGTILGEYTLSLPEGVVQNELGYVNPAQTFSFTVVEDVTTELVLSFTGYDGDEEGLGLMKVYDMDGNDVTPSNGMIPVSFKGAKTEYTVVMPEGWTVKVFNDVDGQEIALTEEQGGYTETVDEDGSVVVLLTLYPGAAGLDVTVQLIYDDTQVEPVYTNTFNFEVPAAALESLAITVPTTEEALELKDGKMEVSYEGDMFVFEISVSDEYKVEVSSEDVQEGNDTYTVSQKVADGVFTLTVTLYPGSDAADFTVTVSKTTGILNIYDLDGEGLFNVYNMNGVMLLKNAGAADLKLLEPGMYIVNGQKIVVRK